MLGATLFDGVRGLAASVWEFLVELARFVGTLNVHGWCVFLIVTTVFAIYVIAVLWSFYLLMGYSFFKANRYVYRWGKRKLATLDRDFKYRFQVRGFRHKGYFRARELACLLLLLWVVFVAASPRTKGEVFFFLTSTMMIVLANTLQGWNDGKSTGSATGFLKIYYLPALALVGPFFGIEKVLKAVARELKALANSWCSFSTKKTPRGAGPS